MLGPLGQVAYGLTFLFWNGVACSLLKIVTLFGLEKLRSQGICLMIVQFCWKASLFFAPWMSCTPDSKFSAEWRGVQEKLAQANKDAEAGKAPYKPLFILGNHVSFFDTILYTATAPPGVLWKCRTYMAHTLFNLPVVSLICKAVGHFAVHFTSEEEGVFKVNRDATDEVNVFVDAHIKEGGWLCFFPEGQMNKNPDEIMDFRYGGMKKALEQDARLVFFICVGNTKVWPKKAKIGGLPGKVKYGLKFIAPDGAKAWVAKIRADSKTSAEDKKMEDYQLLSKYGQIAMQEYYDELKSSMARKSKSD